MALFWMKCVGGHSLENPKVDISPNPCYDASIKDPSPLAGEERSPAL
jgi:hypothetical protein